MTHDGITVTLEFISPAKAPAYLAMVPNTPGIDANRQVTKSKVDKWAKAVSEDRWWLTHQGTAQRS